MQLLVCIQYTEYMLSVLFIFVCGRIVKTIE